MNIWHRVVMAGSAVAVWQHAAAKGADVFSGSWNCGKPIDAQRVPSPSSLYDSPVPFGLVEVGSPIRSGAARKKALPPGVTAARILYHTPTSSGKYAVASDVLLSQSGTPVHLSRVVMTHCLLRMRARKSQRVCAQRECEHGAVSLRELDAIDWSTGRLANKSNGWRIDFAAHRRGATAIDSGNRKKLHG
jgi:hypothetical protein